MVGELAEFFALLLALEVLIAADLLRTVSLSLTISGVLALGLLVVVRTILSFAIQIETEGNLPWRVGCPYRDPHEVSRLADCRTLNYCMPES